MVCDPVKARLSDTKNERKTVRNHRNSGMQSWCTWVDHDRIDEQLTLTTTAAAHIHTHNTYPFFRNQWTEIAHYIIDRDTNRKGHTSINGLSIDFFGKELGGLCRHDRVTKLAKIEDLCSHLTLRNNTLQRKIDNLGCFLVLGADVTVCVGVCDAEEVSEEEEVRDDERIIQRRGVKR